MSETLTLEKQPLTTQKRVKPHTGKKFYIETYGCEFPKNTNPKLTYYIICGFHYLKKSQKIIVVVNVVVNV